MQFFTIAAGALVLGLVAPGAASAQPRSALSLGGTLGLSPVGSLDSQLAAGGLTLSADTETAYGFGGVAEFRVTPNVSIGFAPSLVFNVKPEAGNDAGTGLDLPLRLIAGAGSSRARVYGFLAPGYSVLFLPDSQPIDFDLGDPSGFSFGLGLGGGFSVARGLALTAELGYQWRFLSSAPRGIDIEVDYNSLTFALGFLAAID